MSLTNTDIYDITSSINELIKRFVGEEDEETLALDLYGFITSLESKKIQTAVMMTSELSNEVFPSRAKIDKNVITHAIMQNITNINATPSSMVVTIGIQESDITSYLDEKGGNVFRIDADELSIQLYESEEDDVKYEFHIDYDIILTRNSVDGEYVYSAIYDMDRKNQISNIDNPYLKQPYRINQNGIYYVFFQCTIHQVQITHTYSQIVSSNIIDNKTLTFNFNNQLADFEVIVTQGDEKYYLTPVFEGAGIDSDIDLYCNYVYVNTNTIRIKFDRKSFMPALNAEIDIRVTSTEGTKGNFTYIGDEYNNGVATATMNSEKYDYSNITIRVIPNTKASGGVDRKSVEELQRILPKEILSRGLISTDEDLDNFFNLINTEENRLAVYNKVDNQFSRIKYTYFLMKDSNGDIIPTNTINLKLTSMDMVQENGRYILPAGTLIRFDSDTFEGRVSFRESPREINDSESNIYYYTTLYSMMINPSPLYTAFFLNVVREDPYLTFEYINQNTPVQFICENIHVQRNLIENNNNYLISFTANQSIKKDMGIIEYEEETGKITTVNLRAFMVFYMDGSPYRYKEVMLNVNDIDDEEFIYNWETELKTDNALDDSNNIRILNNLLEPDRYRLKMAGTGENAYGYMDSNVQTRIYILGRFDKEYGRKDLDDIVNVIGESATLRDWSVLNVYEVYGGLSLFTDYSSISNVSIDADTSIEDLTQFTVKGIPVIGHYYIEDDEKVFDLVDQLHYKKMYIDNARQVLENSFEVDFKLFNTYGPSRTFYLDKNFTKSIGRVDVRMLFELQLKSSTDVYTKDAISQYIKEYVEDINELGDLHINNLLTDIREKYKSAIVYFDFLGFNGFDGRQLHIYQESLEEIQDGYIPPEFINIRNVEIVNGEVINGIEITTVS